MASGKTHLKIEATQSVTANTAGAAYALTTLDTGVNTYYLAVYVAGATDVFLTPVGEDATSGLRVATGASDIFGPFHRDDGAYELYSSAGSACKVNILTVTGEG